MIYEYVSHNLNETDKLAKELAERLSEGDIILFFGGLGAGKTTFTKSLGEALGVNDTVHSPTFTLIHEHTGRKKLNHIDLYRLDSQEEINNIGFDEYLYSDGITVVEWTEKLGDFLPKGAIKIRIEVLGENERKFILSSDSKSYEKMLGETVSCIS